MILRSTSSPHLYLDTIKNMIKDDDELLPQTRRILMLMKQHKKSFVQLPLQMEVIVSPINKCNLERALSPQLMGFTKTDWSDNDVKRYKENKEEFLNKVKLLYDKMGFEVKEELYNDETVLKILEDLKIAAEKFNAKIAKAEKLLHPFAKKDEVKDEKSI